MKKLNLFLTLGALLLATNMWGNHSGTHYSKAIAITTGNGKVYVSTSSSSKEGGSWSGTNANDQTSLIVHCPGVNNQNHTEISVYYYAEANTGYHFLGWSENANETSNYENVSPKTVTFTITDSNNNKEESKADTKKTLYAYFAINTYTIAFDENAQDATGTTESVNATYSQNVTLTTNGFERDGWNFDGWNTQADGLGTTYGDGDIVNSLTAEHEATVTLYAQWSQSAVDPNMVQNITTFHPNKLYNNVVESSNKESVLTLSVANESEAGVAEFLTGNVLRVYKMGTFDIVANQPEVAGKFNAVVGKVVANCTVTETPSIWVSEDYTAGTYYLYNVGNGGFLNKDGKIYSNLTQASAWTVGKKDGEESYNYKSDNVYIYMAGNNTSASMSTNQADRYYAKEQSTTTANAFKLPYHYSDANHYYFTATTTRCSKTTTNDETTDWLFFRSLDQYKACVAYDIATSFVNNAAFASMKNELIQVLSENDNESENDYATRFANLNAINKECLKILAVNLDGQANKLIYNAANANQFIAEGASDRAVVNANPLLVSAITTDENKETTFTFGDNGSLSDAGNYIINIDGNANKFYAVGDNENGYKLYIPNDVFWAVGLEGTNLKLVESRFATLWKIKDATPASLSVNAEVDYGTFVAPFAVTLPEGVEAYNAVKGAGDWITLNPMELTNNVLPAGTPAILKSESGAAQTYYGNATSAEPNNSGILKGVYTATQARVGSYVLQMQNDVFGFYHVEEAVKPTVGANRCYIMLEEPVSTSERLDIVIGGNPVVTGMQNIFVKGESKKALLNGKIVIFREGKMYNVNGMLVK